jgi:TolB-like protein/tetratricopeptide (TPR) repeat protein
MANIGDIGRWVAENESLLSGLVALVVLVGLVLSPVGKGMRRLYARYGQSQSSTTSPEPIPATDPAATTEPLLAVLAFDNLSSDPEMEFFSDGISEEIIRRLSRGAQLKVIGRTSSFQFRGERKAEAAKALNCSHVLDGSIRRAAGRVRISAHLLEASSHTTLWSDRYDGSLEDVFTVQDEISENIARSLNQTFSSFPTQAVDPEVYDLYLRTSPKSFAPDELRSHVSLLEDVTRRAPNFAEAWGRLAYVRAFLNFYQPFAERAASAALVEREAAQALALDAQNIDAMIGQLFVLPPFGKFVEAGAILERIKRAPGSGDGSRYIGWYLRTMGHIRESLDDTERTYRLDALDPMSANTVALARMAAGQVAEAIPVYEDLVARVPDMTFPVSSLLRAYAFQEEWAAVDRLLALAAKRNMREFQDTLPFVQAKRDLTPENIDGWRRRLQEHVAETGGVDVSLLVYSAHLGLVEEAYQATETARLGPDGTSNDIMGPDGYRTSLLFQAGMPEMRNDPRFARLCARLGLVEYWMTTGKWPDCTDEVPYDFKAECAKVEHIPKDDFGI